MSMKYDWVQTNVLRASISKFLSTAVIIFLSCYGDFLVWGITVSMIFHSNTALAPVHTPKQPSISSRIIYLQLNILKYLHNSLEYGSKQ